MSFITALATSSWVDLISSLVFFLASFLYVWSVVKQSWKKWFKKEKAAIDKRVNELIPDGHFYVYDTSAVIKNRKKRGKK